MSRIGRPRALSDAQRRDVCALLSTGCGARTAADYVGCSPSTIRREGIRNPEFYQQLRNAELHCQVTPLQHILKAAATNWRAAAWFLERTQPDQFGRAQPIQGIELVSDMMDRVLDAIQHEIQDPQLANRINLVVRTLIGKWERDSHAVKHHRRDPDRAKRLLAEIDEPQPAPKPPTPAVPTPAAPAAPRANVPNPLGFTQEDYDDLGNFDDENFEDDDEYGPAVDLELKRRLDNDEWPYKLGALPPSDTPQDFENVSSNSSPGSASVPDGPIEPAGTEPAGTELGGTDKPSACQLEITDKPSACQCEPPADDTAQQAPRVVAKTESADKPAVCRREPPAEGFLNPSAAGREQVLEAPRPGERAERALADDVREDSTVRFHQLPFTTPATPRPDGERVLEPPRSKVSKSEQKLPDNLARPSQHSSEKREPNADSPPPHPGLLEF